MNLFLWNQSFVYLFSHKRKTRCAVAVKLHVCYFVNSPRTYSTDVHSNIANAVAVILLLLLTFQLFHHESITYKDKSYVSGCSRSFWSFCIFLQSFCLCTILFMGERSGRQERSKKPELVRSETMKAGADVQNGKEEAEEPKAKDQRLMSVFGVADLKNGNNVLLGLHSCFLFLMPAIPLSALRFPFLLFFTSFLRNIQMILILSCQITIWGFLGEDITWRSQSFFFFKVLKLAIAAEKV